jgi:hypothetical protein
VKFSRQKSARSLLKIYLSKRGEREENQDRSVAFESTFQKGFILGFRPMQEKALSGKRRVLQKLMLCRLFAEIRERKRSARKRAEKTASN